MSAVRVKVVVHAYFLKKIQEPPCILNDAGGVCSLPVLNVFGPHVIPSIDIT